MKELIGVRLPEFLTIKNSVTVNGTRYNSGKVKPYAMRTDKNGFPHFLFCIDGIWIWLSAKYFTTEM